jgi:hypothetical protein
MKDNAVTFKVLAVTPVCKFGYHMHLSPFGLCGQGPIHPVQLKVPVGIIDIGYDGSSHEDIL